MNEREEKNQQKYAQKEKNDSEGGTRMIDDTVNIPNVIRFLVDVCVKVLCSTIKWIGIPAFVFVLSPSVCRTSFVAQQHSAIDY